MTIENRRTYMTAFILAALAAAAPGSASAGGTHHKKRMLVTFKEGTSRAEREQAAKDMGLTPWSC